MVAPQRPARAAKQEKLGRRDNESCKIRPNSKGQNRPGEEPGGALRECKCLEKEIMADDFENITSSPLQWPHGWKRSVQYVSSKFSRKVSSYRRRDISIGEATQFLLDELRKMGIPDFNVIISSNLRLRMDGLPYSNQVNPNDVGIAVWWRDGKSRKVIALDKYDRIADNLYAVGKTIEAMRGIDRWGSGEILERTFEGFEALPNPDKTTWRDVLGYQGNSLSDCQKIYRVKIKESHPDNGGDVSAAAAINVAWDEAQLELY